MRRKPQDDDIARFNPSFVAAAAEESDALVFVGDKLLKFRQLHGAQLFGRHVIGCGNWIVLHCRSDQIFLSSFFISASVPTVMRSRSPGLGPGK